MPPEDRTMLSHYRIAEKIGEGGMGVVWKAIDTHLDRDVAIKVLPSELAQDPDRLVRFEREAKVLAALNHQNVAAIYGIEHQASDRGISPVLVLEYVPGETLGDLLKRGRLPLEEVLTIGAQIAEGLEAAHEIGVMHRDLKPANVKLTPDGRVKILDFGLAKAFTSEPLDHGSWSSSSDSANSPTITTGGTRIGAILGTASYMSPEQARGKSVDKRGDIWAFGCLLYECLTGKKAFPGETATDVLGAILHLEPNWSALPVETPARVRELLRRCLEKDPKRRLRDIGDARNELQEVAGIHSSQPGASSPGLTAGRPADLRTGTLAGRAVPFPATSGSLMRSGLLLAAGALLGIFAWSVIGSGARNGRAGGNQLIRASVVLPAALEVRPGFRGLLPDGRTLALVARPRDARGADAKDRIYTRTIDRFEFLPLKGTDGALGFASSPDGRWLVFVASTSADSSRRRLLKVPIDGSSLPVVVADWQDAWGSLVCLEDGEYLTSTDGGRNLVRIGSDGKVHEPVKIEAANFSGQFNLVRTLPEDRGVLAQTTSYSSRGYQIGSAVVDPETGKARIVVADGGLPAYSPTGHLLFSRGPVLLAAPFDLDAMEVTGNPTAVLDGLRTEESWSPGRFTLSADGTLQTVPGGLLGLRRRVVVADALGLVHPWSDDKRAFTTEPAVSPDGRHVAQVVANASAIYEIWISDRDRPTFRRIVAHPDADCFSPVWSPDGRSIAYTKIAESEQDGIYIQSVDGSDRPRRVMKFKDRTHQCLPSSWSRDGSTLFLSQGSAAEVDLVSLRIPAPGESEAQAQPVAVNGAREFDAHVSPDGRWLLYSTDETGRPEVQLAPLRGDGTLGVSTPVSREGGNNGHWSADGRTIYFVNDQDWLVSVPVTTAPELRLGQEKAFLDLEKLRAAAPKRGIDILPDGRFVFVEKGEDEEDVRHWDLTFDYGSELVKKVPTAGG